MFDGGAFEADGGEQKDGQAIGLCVLTGLDTQTTVGELILFRSWAGEFLQERYSCGLQLVRRCANSIKSQDNNQNRNGNSYAEDRRPYPSTVIQGVRFKWQYLPEVSIFKVVDA